MSKWFQDRRQEFIAATLKTFGQVSRYDLIREFDISLPQASADINTFKEKNAGFIIYDVTAKAYVIKDDVAKEEGLDKVVGREEVAAR